ncbi:MAG: hypothetical protein IH968_13030, partial [Gemmatimonadetes bacterium]|nr:hypothetical protein [Gemmatimonadota bacterium]
MTTPGDLARVWRARSDDLDAYAPAAAAAFRTASAELETALQAADGALL